MMNGTTLPENHGSDTSHYTADAICKRISYIQTKHRVNFFQLKRVLEEGLGHDHIAVNTKAPQKGPQKASPYPLGKCLLLEVPSSPNFRCPPWGGYWYFLELHNHTIVLRA